MKVWPTSDAMRKMLMHPGVRVPFPASGPLDWPDDAFTTRRIADGDVTTADPSPTQPSANELRREAGLAPIPQATDHVTDYGTDHTKPPIQKPVQPKKSKGE